MSEWQPIESAPKDGTRVWLWVSDTFVGGWWNDNRYAAKPRPYWSNDKENVRGTTWARNNQPTHWMPLPTPPITKD